MKLLWFIDNGCSVNVCSMISISYYNTKFCLLDIFLCLAGEKVMRSNRCHENRWKADREMRYAVITGCFCAAGKKKEENHMQYESKLCLDYEKLEPGEYYPSQLLTEYRQSMEEGLDVGAYQALFEAAAQMPDGHFKQDISDILFQIIWNAGQRDKYEYEEPSELEKIKDSRELYEMEEKKVSEDQLYNKIYGAWLGRICGCLLGKPLEGMYTKDMVPLLKQSGNYPMHRYILSTDETKGMRGGFWADTLACAPADDDTNYTVLAQVLIENYGRDFTPENVSRVWLDYQPMRAYWTAERAAYRNFVAGYLPPYSAVYKNPYREWIGAQIRGDYYGYINPGNPELAAEMAWRDACISHVKNGIYGEMFVAAMLACAAVTDDLEDILQGGLAQIPCRSRLYEAVQEIISDFHSGVTKEACFAGIHERYDECDEHDGTHTIPNALIVAAALLYGEGDFGRSICMAVETGFDTDCNGATVGSVLGMRNGADCIEEKWEQPIHGALNTDIFGMDKIQIRDCVERTIKHIV